MAFDISNDNYLATIKIDLAKEMGEGAFVELREPSKKEFLILQKSYSEGLLDFEDKFMEMFPHLIVSHGFIVDGKPATSEAVATALGKKTLAINKVEADFFAWATGPFQTPKEPASKA